MAQNSSHKNYMAWPSDRQEREDQAREILGEHLVAAYDSWLDIAERMLFHGYQYKSPNEEQTAFLSWINSLSETDKQNAAIFVRYMLEGVVFSILNCFDGSSGCVLQETVQERLRLMLEIQSRDGTAAVSPVEVLALNSPESQEERGIELHDLWYSWLQRYSKRGSPSG
jgi:hypothetical protein